MTPLRTLTTALVWAGLAGDAFAQAMNPAPPIAETAPAGTNSPAVNLAATDFNWVWASLVVMGLVLGLWYLLRRRQSRDVPRP